ncbi:hypothetical protein C8F04DRAFT_1343172 [Mycena alexandri]|uniref:Uncharacterized protein n=1 Tax=Mycena alexandri TaxID=1745969 RepID=A0AAD6TGT2_9AGAR|nr:hypothetical protein C8F04DRAFT_1343172 [Mycena alexandri]
MSEHGPADPKSAAAADAGTRTLAAENLNKTIHYIGPPRSRLQAEAGGEGGAGVGHGVGRPTSGPGGGPAAPASALQSQAGAGIRGARRGVVACRDFEGRRGRTRDEGRARAAQQRADGRTDGETWDRGTRGPSARLLGGLAVTRGGRGRGAAARSAPSRLVVVVVVVVVLWSSSESVGVGVGIIEGRGRAEEFRASTIRAYVQQRIVSNPAAARGEGGMNGEGMGDGKRKQARRASRGRAIINQLRCVAGWGGGVQVLSWVSAGRRFIEYVQCGHAVRTQRAVGGGLEKNPKNAVEIEVQRRRGPSGDASVSARARQQTHNKVVAFSSAQTEWLGFGTGCRTNSTGKKSRGGVIQESSSGQAKHASPLISQLRREGGLRLKRCASLVSCRVNWQAVTGDPGSVVVGGGSCGGKSPRLRGGGSSRSVSQSCAPARAMRAARQQKALLEF